MTCGKGWTMLTLEKYTENDYPLYSRLVFNEQVMRMNLGRVFTEEEAALFFQMVLRCNDADSELGYYKVFSGQGGDRVYLGLGALNWNDDCNAAEIEYMLLPPYWHQGYGTELARLLLQKAEEACGATEVVAITAPANIASKRLLERVGFALVKQYVNPDGDTAELYRKSMQ